MSSEDKALTIAGTTVLGGLLVMFLVAAYCHHTEAMAKIAAGQPTTRHAEAGPKPAGE